MAFQYNIIKEFEKEGKKGRREGRRQGRIEGKREGKKILNTLNQCLKDDGRIDELLASVDNTRLQNKLLKEYGLSTTVK